MNVKAKMEWKTYASTETELFGKNETRAMWKEGGIGYESRCKFNLVWNQFGMSVQCMKCRVGVGFPDTNTIHGIALIMRGICSVFSSFETGWRNSRGASSGPVFLVSGKSLGFGRTSIIWNKYRLCHEEFFLLWEEFSLWSCKMALSSKKIEERMHEIEGF